MPPPERSTYISDLEAIKEGLTMQLDQKKQGASTSQDSHGSSPSLSRLQSRNSSSSLGQNATQLALEKAQLSAETTALRSELHLKQQQLAARRSPRQISIFPGLAVGSLAHGQLLS